MATEEAILADPAAWEFIERIYEKGSFPLLILVGLFLLVWKFGWPKFAVSHSEPPPPPNAVVEALTHLQDEVSGLREDTHDRLERIEGDLRILLDRTPRK